MEQIQKGKNICVFFAPGYEEIEALTVVDVLRRAKLPVKMVSVDDTDVVTGAHGITVQMDTKLEALDFQQVEMIVLPGGQPGTRNLEQCASLMQELELFHEQHRPISAICAAPSILGHRGMLTGRKACCYPGMEEHLSGAKLTYAPCVTDDFITTGRGMGAAIPFACEIAARYIGQEAAEELKQSVVYIQK